MDIYDVWPIDMESGPLFLIFMLFFSSVALAGAWLVGALFGKLFESGEAPGIPVGPPVPPGPAQAYRHAPPPMVTPRRRSQVGRSTLGG